MAKMISVSETEWNKTQQELTSLRKLVSQIYSTVKSAVTMTEPVAAGEGITSPKAAITGLKTKKERMSVLEAIHAKRKHKK